MKAGKSSATVTVLPSCAQKFARRLEGLVARGDAADQLDELHHAAPGS